MPEEKINKLNTLGSTISVWSKILIGVFVFIFTVGTAWYQIETNAADNVRQDEQFKQIMEAMTKEFEIMSNRSDKRYQRAMEEANELKAMDSKLWKKGAEQDRQILDLYKEIYYIKGIMSAKK